MSTGRGGPQSFYNGLISFSKPYQPISRPAVPDPGFLAKVEEIRPNYDAQEHRIPGGFWVPPNRSNALTTRSDSECLFRYRSGVFREVAQNDLVRGQLSNPCKVATVFSQAIDADHLLTVPFDARTDNVYESSHDWQRLGFEYTHVQNVGTLASLVFIGEMQDLPAPIPEAWEKLIPQPYRYQRTGSNGNPETSGTTFAGLIGSLPLLVALAAFSACPDQLRAALRTSRTSAGKWVPHNYAPGRISERGLVITIYKDPGYTAGSTDVVLKNLEDGKYGAFYAP